MADLTACSELRFICRTDCLMVGVGGDVGSGVGGNALDALACRASFLTLPTNCHVSRFALVGAMAAPRVQLFGQLRKLSLTLRLADVALLVSLLGTGGATGGVAGAAMVARPPHPTCAARDAWHCR